MEDGSDIRWAHCKICSRKINTSSLEGITHLKNLAAICKSKQASTSQSSGGGNLRGAQPEAQISIYDPLVAREALARFICHAGLPISIGEHLAHERYIRTFAPQYQSVSRATIRSDIVALFNKRRQALMEEINNGTFNVALTSDIWSRRAK